MMKQFNKIIFLLVLVITSCNKNIKIGHECSYKKYEGKAIIISINNAPINENNCPIDPKKLMFVFVPNDSNIKSHYIFKNWSDTAALTINGGINPSQYFIDSLQISIGKEYKCNRAEIFHGTCTPVLFQFEEINLNSSNGCR